MFQGNLQRCTLPEINIDHGKSQSFLVNTIKMVDFPFHQKLNATLPTDLTKQVAIELLDTQVFSGSVQEVRPLEISWIHGYVGFRECNLPGVCP